MTGAPSSDRPLVFFVSSEPDFAECVRVFLEESGYRVQTADGTSPEAVAAAIPLARDLQPDLIMLGLWSAALPRPLQGLRSDPATLTTPIILLCATAPGDPRIVQCRELAEAYLQFPLEMGDLLHLVDRLLGRMSAEDREDLAAWRRVRFSGSPSPEAVAAYLGAGHYPAVSSEARTLLREMSDEALPAVVRVLNDSADPAAWRPALWLVSVVASFSSSEHRRALGALADLLAHPDRERRWDALQHLGSTTVIGSGGLLALVDRGAPVMAEIVSALKGEDRALQADALDALTWTCTSEALSAVREFLPRADAEQRERIERRLAWA